MITLDSALSFYHYGKATSTAADYNGVDMRTEVYLLTRNVKIYGDSTDDWPAHILVTDQEETNGQLNKGSLIMNNVEVDNCSQEDQGRGCIRFEGAIGGANTYSKISNSAVHNGMDWALSLLSAENIEIRNNVFVGFTSIGARIDYTKNVTIVGNYMGDVKSRTLYLIDNTVDKEACWAIGSVSDIKTGVKNIGLTFTDNIAAGCQYAGFIAPGYLACGDVNSRIFYNNVAHSINGLGAYLYNNPLSTSS